MRALVVSVALSLSPAVALAQLAVSEVGPSALNHSITAIQSTITTLQSIILVADSALNLESFGDTGLSGTFEADVLELQGIVAETEAILWNIRSLEAQIVALFGLEGAPDSTTALRERFYEIRRVRSRQLLAAQRVATLQRTAINTVQRIMALWGRILGFLGNKQALQNVNSELTQLNHLAAQHGVVVAAYQQAMLTEAQEAPLIQESIERINTAIMADWPK